MTYIRPLSILACLDLVYFTMADGGAMTYPRIPSGITEEKYERYVEHVIRHIRLPAREYKYPVSDPESAHYDFKGLAMAFDSFPGLKKQMEYIVDHDIEGDIYETGTWRGGTSIFMIAVLRAYEKLRGKEVPGRQYYGFDSFTGFRPQRDDEALDDYMDKAVYTAPLHMVRDSFDKFGLLDDRVHFVKGFFEDTMPTFDAPNKIAALRLDGDLYSSTKVVLDRLYSHVQSGGWIIIDDYKWRPKIVDSDTKLCGDAIDEFREEHGITTPLTKEYDRYSWLKGNDEKSQSQSPFLIWPGRKFSLTAPLASAQGSLATAIPVAGAIAFTVAGVGLVLWRTSSRRGFNYLSVGATTPLREGPSESSTQA